MSDDNAELVALRAELESLKASVTGLQSELASLRDGKTGTMRQDRRCTACGHTRILYLHEVLDRADGNQRKPMSIDKTFWLSAGKGIFEAAVCLSCHLVEWYVRSLEGIKPDGETIRVLDGTPPASPDPYR